MLLTWNMGTICLILSILLGITYLLRKKIKNKWMKLHRVLTVMLVAAVVIHICQMGIKLPDAISSMRKETGISEGFKHTELKDATGETPGIEGSQKSEETQNNQETNATKGAQETEEDQKIGKTETQNTDGLVTFSGAALKDGTYEGSADGYHGTITVSAVVGKGAVTEISIVEENDTPQFFERAKEIIDTIMNRQSLEVEGITGATYSSKGIQNAVYHALQNAVISGELKITEIQISNSHGHGHGPEHQRGMYSGE